MSIKTEDFKNYLYDFFNDKKNVLDDVDWNTWLYCPGMPPIVPEYDTSLINVIDKLVEKWLSWVPTEDCLFSCPFNILEFESLITGQKCLFFTKLQENNSLTLDKLKFIHKVYGMEEVKNAEVKFAWLRLCIKAKWSEKIATALDFVNKQGRMKFVRPIYRDLYNWEEARPIAIENFIVNKKCMMFVLVNQLEKDLHLV